MHVRFAAHITKCFTLGHHLLRGDSLKRPRLRAATQDGPSRRPLSDQKLEPEDPEKTLSQASKVEPNAYSRIHEALGW